MLRLACAFVLRTCLTAKSILMTGQRMALSLLQGWLYGMGIAVKDSSSSLVIYPIVEASSAASVLGPVGHCIGHCFSIQVCLASLSHYRVLMTFFHVTHRIRVTVERSPLQT